MSTEAFEKLARDLEEEARQSESTCIRNYGGIEPTNEQRIRATRKAASLLRQLGCENFLGALGLKVTRKP